MITSKVFLSKLLKDLSLSNQLVAKIIFFPLKELNLCYHQFITHLGWMPHTGFCGNLNLLVIIFYLLLSSPIFIEN